VAETFKGRARGAQPALLDGVPGAVWVQGGRVRSAFVFTLSGDKISGIDLLMQAERLAQLDIALEE
jgi:RNA polymerase sigma-70 factor (ECF subfamily)